MIRMATYDEILATLPESVDYGVVDALRGHVVSELRQADPLVFKHSNHPERTLR